MAEDIDLDPIEDEPAPQSRAASTVKKAHPQRLVSQALSLGIQSDEINDYTTSELINVIQIEQQRLDAQERRKPAPPPPEKEPEIDWGTDDEGKPLSEKDYMPGVAANIKRTHALELKQAKREKELGEKLDAIEEREKRREQAEQGRQMSELRDQMDRLFASKSELFGSKDFDDLDQKGTHYKRRSHIAKMMEGLQGTLKARFKEACEIVYGEREPEDSEPEPQRAPRRVERPKSDAAALDEDRKSWDRNGGVANPSHRKSPEVDEDGPKKAAKAVRKLMRERGINATETTGDEESLLPE